MWSEFQSFKALSIQFSFKSIWLILFLVESIEEPDWLLVIEPNLQCQALIKDPEFWRVSKSEFIVQKVIYSFDLTVKVLFLVFDLSSLNHEASDFDQFIVLKFYKEVL